jgi:hypothetical protein
MAAELVNYRTMTRRLVLAAGIATLGLGCSADAVDAPEPAIDTPGAFVAYEESPGQLRLMRTFQKLVADDNAFLFAAFYDPLLGSYAEAENMARDRSATPQPDLIGLDLTAFAAPYRVVWFRSLSEQERARLR